MNISELNHLENVNESNVVKGGYVSVGTNSYAYADGILPSTYSYSDISISESNYSDYYYGFSEYTSGYGSSSAGASALAGYASASSSAYGNTGYSFY